MTDIASETIVQLTTAILFVVSAIAGVVSSVPVFINANASAGNIMALQRAIGAPPRLLSENARVAVPPTAFKRIEVRDRSRSPTAKPASAGFPRRPVQSVTFKAGETVFISGGNGSGKPTSHAAVHVAVLAARRLHRARRSAGDARKRRELSRALHRGSFQEYHLFQGLYGAAPEALVGNSRACMKLFEIEDKTEFVDGAFTTVSLSAGQRKRVALIVAMLERRPICVLDEWAADQDPLFRRKFYEDLLLMFKARGMIHHRRLPRQDRYFDVADCRRI